MRTEAVERGTCSLLLHVGRVVEPGVLLEEASAKAANLFDVGALVAVYRTLAPGATDSLLGLEVEAALPHTGRWVRRRVLRDVSDDGSSTSWEGVPRDYEGMSGVIFDEVTRETLSVKGRQEDGLRPVQRPDVVVTMDERTSDDASRASARQLRLVATVLGVILLAFSVRLMLRRRRRRQTIDPP